MECKLAGALEKIFSAKGPLYPAPPLSILRGETASFQAAILARDDLRVTASCPGFSLRVREVLEMPVRMPSFPDREDENYLSTAPGLFPDLLRDLPGGILRARGRWKAVWIDADPEADCPAGKHEILVTFESPSGEKETAVQTVTLVDAALPPQTLLHTEWFHADCLADYYGVEPLGEEHWRILENFLRAAARMGINMILTPVLTPPLDTAVGGERTTVQLVKIRRDEGIYSFDFSGLRRWVELCLSVGIDHFEISHFYTQWGAEHAPKVMAEEDGEYRRIFGWETDAVGGPYAGFLRVFLPALREELIALGVYENCRFHISDEPSEAQLPAYTAARDQAKALLPDAVFMDALSHFAFYEKGVVTHPVVASNSADLPKFVAAGVPDLWIYYCCGQGVGVSNRFLAMPGGRTRVIGTQLFLGDFSGFLQWGFNFYNTERSLRRIDPYAVTDGLESWPAGDPFIVYPGKGGVPEESIRYMYMRMALHDLRALRLLESLVGKDAAHSLVSEAAGGELTLSRYPSDPGFLPALRVRVNEAVEKALSLRA